MRAACSSCGGCPQPAGSVFRCSSVFATFLQSTTTSHMLQLLHVAANWSCVCRLALCLCSLTSTLSAFNEVCVGMAPSESGKAGALARRQCHWHARAAAEAGKLQAKPQAAAAPILGMSMPKQALNAKLAQAKAARVDSPVPALRHFFQCDKDDTRAEALAEVKGAKARTSCSNAEAGSGGRGALVRKVRCNICMCALPTFTCSSCQLCLLARHSSASSRGADVDCVCGNHPQVTHCQHCKSSAMNILLLVQDLQTLQ